MPFIPSGAAASGTAITSATITQTAHGFAVNQAVYLSGVNTWAKARADADATSDVVGIVSTVVDANNFKITQQGLVTGLAGLTAGSALFLSDVTAGLMTHTAPTATSSYRKPLGIAESATTAWINIEVGTPTNGNTAVVQIGETLISGGSTITTALADVTGSSFTLPSAGTWDIEYYVYYTHNTGLQSTSIGVYDSSNVLVANSQSISPSISGVAQSPPFAGNVRIITTGATTYKLRGITSSGTATVVNAGTSTAGAANSRISWTQIGASPVPMSFAGEYVAPVYAAASSVATTGTTPATAVDYLSISIPTAGTWQVNWTVKASNAGLSAGVVSGLFDTSNNLLANSETLTNFFGAATTQQCSGSGDYIITTTGAATYKVRIWGNSVTGATALSDVNGRSFVMARKISGFLPITGSTVDYVNAIVPINSTVPAVGSPMTLTVASGNIPLASNTFTLTAGKTYRLEAGVTRVDAGTEFVYQWRDTTNSVYLGSQGTVATNPAPMGSIASAVITPASSTTVQLWSVKTAGTSGANISANGGTISAGFATITQLGSTATTTRTLSSMMVTNLTSPSIPNSGAATAVTTGWVVSHDPTGAFSTTTGLFTCPRGGRYQVNFNYTYNSAIWAVANLWRAHILKNGTPVAQNVNSAQAAVTTILGQVVSHVIDCAAGDTISVAASNTRATGATVFTANAIENVWSIAELPSAV